jgi:phytoene dehydrogenase-like protein
MPSCDAIVIGGGTNGLACAFRLQKSGRKVIVLESHSEVGGAATARGAKISLPLAHLVNKLDQRVEAQMNLSAHGLRWLNANLPTTVLSHNGNHLNLSGAAGEVLGGDVSGDEQAAWTKLRERLMRFASLLAPFKNMPPPRLAKNGNNNWLKLAQTGLKLRMMGRYEMREFMRLLLINVYDVLEDELSNPQLKGVLAFDATLGSWLGPRSPNSLILLLDRLAGQIGGQQGALALPAGDAASVASAMAASVRAAGVEIRTGASVSRVIVENDKAMGVALAGGEEIKAPIVVSAISPKTTFLSLVGHQFLDTGFVNRIRHQKSRGAAAKLHLKLKALPDFKGADLKSRLVIAPSSEAVELAYNPVKYGGVPEKPVMEIVVPSAFDGSEHSLSAIVQYAPHDPVMGKNKARGAMLANTLAQLERHAPGIGKLITGIELLMPYDIEERYGMAGGNWHHGELSVEQMLFLRPVPGFARYATPLRNLWLASAGCHPGGGISGTAGWNAAEAIMGARS